MNVIEQVYDNDDGRVCAVSIRGHVDDDTAVAFTWSWLHGQLISAAVDRPRRTWMRKVPRWDEYGYVCLQYVEAKGPGPGAFPVTEVRLSTGRRPTCASPGCPWESWGTRSPSFGYGPPIPLCEGHWTAGFAVSLGYLPPPRPAA